MRWRALTLSPDATTACSHVGGTTAGVEDFLHELVDRVLAGRCLADPHRPDWNKGRVADPFLSLLSLRRSQHSAGKLPLTDTNPLDGSRGQQPLNSLDYNPLLRATLVQMDR
ncbi:MAG TPA: hypothetical protein VE687_09215 [Stellaceae bacterium]|nr:hypothetical protein [Stellaceae bacterium]